MSDGPVLRDFVCPKCREKARLPQRYLDPRRSLDRAKAPKLYALPDRCAALLEARPQHPGVLKLSADEWAEIDAELAPGYRGAARQLLES